MLDGIFTDAVAARAPIGHVSLDLAAFDDRL